MSGDSSLTQPPSHPDTASCIIEAMNNMRLLNLLSLLLSLNLSFSTCLAVEPVKVESKEVTILSLDRTKIKQGEFFQALIKNANKPPRIWFNSKEFPSYEIICSPKTYRVLIPVENMTNPGKYSILAKLDSWEQKIPVEVTDNGKGVSKITLSPDKADLYPTEKELNYVGRNLHITSPTKLWRSKFIYPSKADRSSPFGVKRSYNGGPVDSYHKGLDFAGEMGSPVYAPADARVLLTGYEKDGFVVHGNTIILDHGQSVTSIYMHLSKIDVKEGQPVKQGDKIGEVGHTGVSTGPHLHWGVYLSGVSTEPELFVKQEVL